MATQKIPGRAIKIGTDTIGDVMYYDGATWTRLPIGEAGEVLTMNEAGTFPVWGSVWTYPGLTYGYLMGGNTPSYLFPTTDIEKYSMTSDTNSVSVADLTVARNYTSEGNVSQTHGYCCGGHSGPGGGGTHFDIVEKFQYSNDADATDVGDMTIEGNGMANSASDTHGYNAGGTPHGATYPTAGNVIEKFAFATDANSTDVDDMFFAVSGCSGHSSITHGYAAGGSSNGAGPNNTDMIQKWSMVTDATGTDVANLTSTKQGRTGSSSLTHGYKIAGSTNASIGLDEIEKFTFASDSNATRPGDLTAIQYGSGGGASSEANGYIASGNSAVGYIVRIEKFSHVTDGNATHIADVATSRNEASGNHV